MRPILPWQRNLYAIWIAELIAIVGFGVAQPFIPYFIRELGVQDLAQVELYSGLSLSIPSITMTLVSPIWGGLADRYGRKLMVERAMFGGAALYALNAFVQDVPSYLLLRAFQGALTGTVAAATTLVASSAPRERAGSALGALQVAVYLGSLLGPVFGGLVADVWGYRAAFGFTSVLLGLGGLCVVFLVQEDFVPAVTRANAPFLRRMMLVMSSAALLPIFALRIMMRLGDRTLLPILPLFVESLSPAESRVASTTGLLFGVAAGASAIGALLLGRVSDRIGERIVLFSCFVGMAVVYALQFLVAETYQLLILQALLGLAMGGTLTALSASLARFAPAGQEGMVYGVDASAVSIAHSIGPVLGAGMAVGLGLRPVFLLAAGTALAAGLLVARWIPQAAPVTETRKKVSSVG